MSFTDRDKDYFFGLLENILKCVYVEACSYGTSISRSGQKEVREVREFMEKFELLNKEIPYGNLGNRPANCEDPDNPKHVCYKDCL